MKYFLSNKKRCIAIVIIIVISVFAIYLVSTLVESIFRTAEDSNIKALSKFSIINTKGNELGISESDWNEVESNETVDSIYDAYIETTYINNIFGQTTALMLYVSEKDLYSLFDYCDYTLASGTMPSANEYEIVVHDNMLKNRDLQLGDILEVSSGTYKIVGTYRGEGMSAFGIKNHSIEQLSEIGADVDNIHFAGILLPKGELSSMNSFLGSLNNNKIDVSSVSIVKDKFDEQTESINMIMSLIIIIVVISISAAIGVVLSTLYSNRIDEFGIMNAIGYSKKRIIGKVIKEVVCLILLAWILGIIISLMLLNIVNQTIFVPMGQSMNLLNSNSLLYTIFSLLAILVISISPSIIKLAKSDLISVIERR